jgi:FdhE protein
LETPGRDRLLAEHIRARPHLRDIFQFYEKIEEIWNASHPDDLLPLIDLRDASVRGRLSEGIPLVDRPAFARIPLTQTALQFRKIITVMKQGGGEREIYAQRISTFMRNSHKPEGEMIGDLLAREDGHFDNVSGVMEVPRPLLVYLLKMSLRISFERLHETLMTFLREIEWEFPHCPVCGAPPVIGQAISNSRRRYYCFFCSFHWECQALEGCPSCGETDTEFFNLLYKHPNEHQGILACETCRTYLKMLDQRAGPDLINPDIQEVVGLHLDMAAGEMGLRPLGQPAAHAEVIKRAGIDDYRP